MDENDYGAIGFMFDQNHSKSKLNVVLSNGNNIHLSLIDEDPGHVQSGQYLWPAAEYAANHIISNWGRFLAKGAIEFGAGCGLAGLSTAKLGGCEHVLLTDYDAGSLELLEENIRLNDSQETVKAHFYEWGTPFSSLKAFTPEDGFQLIIGTDLLYSKDVVFPLLKSVKECLDLYGGVFVLVSSFAVGEGINTEVENCIQRLSLDVDEVEPLDVVSKKCRVQYFRNSVGNR